MGTAVLRSHNPFNDRFHVETFGSRPPPPPMKSSRRKPTRSGPSSPPLTARSNRSPPPPQAAGPSGRGVLAPRPGGGMRVSFAADKENANTNAVVVRFPSRNLVMEEVKILKRGESPPPPQSAADRRSGGVSVEVSPLFSTNRLGPDPAILPKQIGFYAGPTYITSPAPSSVPFPASFLKNRGTDEAERSDLATRNLRCLLRLGNQP